MEDMSQRIGKTTFSERCLMVEDTFGGGRPLVEDNLWWKRTFSGRQPLVEDDLRGKMTFGGRRPPVEDNQKEL